MDEMATNSDQEHAVIDLDARYTATNPKSYAQFLRAGRFLPGGSTRMALYYDPFPIVIDHAAGNRVTDLDGHTYIDLQNDLTAGLYGHSNATIVSAVKAALDNGISLGGPTVHEERLAEAICARFAAIERVRFCNSDTEANLLALQLARAATDRTMVLVFEGDYHGNVVSYLSGLIALNVERDRTLVAKYNDIRSARGVVSWAAGDLAAIIVEPMMGSAGGIVADWRFLKGLRQLADETRSLLVFDEVHTARLSYGGLQEVFGIRPDLTVLGNFIGGGLPFGAVGGRADIIDQLGPSRSDRIGHGGTYNNNVLTMVAGFTGLDRLATSHAIDGLNTRSDRLRQRLGEIARSHGVPLAIGGYGSILLLHFQEKVPRDPAEVTTSSTLRKVFHLEMLLCGIYMSRRGTINLSLETSEADCDAFADRFDGVLARYGHLFRGSS